MPTSNIERVARAAFPAAYRAAGFFGGAAKWAEAKEAARNIVKAMRDLPDADGPQMLVAGKQALLSCAEDPQLEDARRCWHAMIDTLLAASLG